MPFIFLSEFCDGLDLAAKTPKAQRNFAHKYRLPIAKIGKSYMLDREAGIRRLREYAIYPETPEVAEREDATAPEAPVEAVAPMKTSDPDTVSQPTARRRGRPRLFAGSGK